MCRDPPILFGESPPLDCAAPMRLIITRSVMSGVDCGLRRLAAVRLVVAVLLRRLAVAVATVAAPTALAAIAFCAVENMSQSEKYGETYN